jgi:hypothetical protein
MEKKKIDRIIQIIREQMVANAPGALVVLVVLQLLDPVAGL